MFFIYGGLIGAMITWSGTSIIEHPIKFIVIAVIITIGAKVIQFEKP